MVDFDEYKMGFVSFERHPLAKGGQKTVYAATHAEYGSVVVKLVKGQDARTKREIEIVVRNSFENVPHIYETSEVLYGEEEMLAIVEERVDGENLRDVIVSGRRFDLLAAASFLEDSLKFLEQISQKGIVHRDIKPENIILVDGHPVFIDFGIARVLGAESLTETGHMGPNTPGYAAPEQFSGMKDRLDGRADLFSIGVVTYELITGVNPFSKNAESPFAIYYNTVTITPIDHAIPGDEQKQFMGLLSVLMSKSASQRPRDATQALQWLESARKSFVYEGES